ncbi:unnamed protein product [Didymodactylos carnosus]|uniref:ubiquitinyl hydrolase 1 n=1 Tax=Didymodactylos carnosus TaxID=1234261 RepID=A0A8S2E9M5_9BILA|nr:unnamed protein product [Didymodactylos carnosus]CAF3867222.1 unnamed protein product [Didymodactylos carnosus]
MDAVKQQITTDNLASSEEKTYRTTNDDIRHRHVHQTAQVVTTTNHADRSGEPVMEIQNNPSSVTTKISTRFHRKTKSSTTPYHERQQLQLCGLHSLNNLFQAKDFSKHSLDAIVKEYDKSCFLGNYDLQIILEALKRRDYTVRAIDINESFDIFDFDRSFGLLLNIPIERSIVSRLPFLRSLAVGRHWLTIKNIDGTYYNLDSKLNQPVLLGDKEHLIDYLNKLDRSKSYIYIVIHQSLAADFAQK